MGGDARLARGSGARPKPGRALERDPSPMGEGRPQSGRPQHHRQSLSALRTDAPSRAPDNQLMRTERAHNLAATQLLEPP